MSLFDKFRGDKPHVEPSNVIEISNAPAPFSWNPPSRESEINSALSAMAWAVPHDTVIDTMDDAALNYSISTAIPTEILGWYAKQTFIGWQACAIMATHWLIGRACKMPIDDAVKNGWEVITSKADTAIEPARLEAIKAFDKKIKIKKKLENFGFFGRVFGVRVAIFKIDGYTAEEYGKPLNLDDIGIARQYKGIALVDPQYCIPVVTNTHNPIDDDFMQVSFWQVGGIRYHHSFCVVYRHADVAQTMKAVYMNAGSISLCQQIYEKVYLAEQATSEANRLLQSKRTYVRKGDVEGALLDQQSFEAKVSWFSRMLNNFGILFIDRDDDASLLETSLTELTNVIGQKFEHVCAVSGIPSNRLMMTQLTGFAASGEAEEKIYHDLVTGIQANDLAPMVEMHTRLSLLSSGQLADDIEVQFNSPASYSEKEKADLNATKSQTDSALVNIQAIPPEAVAEKWAKDKIGGYAGIDLTIQEDLDDGGLGKLIDGLNGGGDEEFE